MAAEEATSGRLDLEVELGGREGGDGVLGRGGERDKVVGGVDSGRGGGEVGRHTRSERAAGRRGSDGDGSSGDVGQAVAILGVLGAHGSAERRDDVEGVVGAEDGGLASLELGAAVAVELSEGRPNDGIIASLRCAQLVKRLRDLC